MKTFALKNIALLILVLWFNSKCLAQGFSENWSAHFSYLNVKTVVSGNNKVYAVSDNAIFSLDTNTNIIQELTTVNGLSGETISTIYYSPEYKLLVIGYIDGLIEIVFDDNSDVLSVVDIINKITIPRSLKKINHIKAHENLIYISTDYGISVYNLERLEFGDTYFIGENGTALPVKQTEVYGDYLYAACANNNGIKRADFVNTNLFDFTNWNTYVNGSFTFISTLNAQLFTIDSARRLYDISSGTLNLLTVYDTAPTDFKIIDKTPIVTTSANVFMYDTAFNLLNTVPSASVFGVNALASTKIQNTLYIGTSGRGVMKTDINDPLLSEEIHPDGPLVNRAFSLNFTNGNLRVLFGGYSIDYAWSGGVQRSGLSKLTQGKWHNIAYDSLSTVINEPYFLSNLSVNPFNEKQLFLSSYFSGLIEMNDEKPVALINKDNSTIVPFAANFHLTHSSSYDEKGVLWLLNGRVDKPLNKFENGTWSSFSFNDIISNPGTNNGFSNIVFNDQDIFFGSFGYGLIGFRENNGNHILKNISEEEQNMPSNKVLTVAIDNRNQLWIGTLDGLRVLYNPSDIFENETVRAEEIIIEEDGVAKELLFQQIIKKIIVDGANNKWIGTGDSGLFYVSADGQKTIYHFTKENSPLPSNIISDLVIDGSSGTLYIATEKGLVSFQTGSTSPTEDFEVAHAYPNPVRPGFNITEQRVKIKNIPENVNIKITDITGNLVAEAQSRINQRYQGYNLEIDGGIAYWNGKNMANTVVASGVYLIMLADLDNLETKVLKLMVVR